MRYPAGVSTDADKKAPAGYSWADYLSALTQEHGTLTALAWKLIERTGAQEDVASVERALRRLRPRGQRDGGAWGARLLRVFGIPTPVEARLRWMGLYQSPFNDLPLPLCLDLLRAWDRPPISGSRARLWLHLGFGSCALRRREFGDAEVQLSRALGAVAGLPASADAARIEIALARGYLRSHHNDAQGVEQALREAEALLESASLPQDEAVCFRARLVDQRAYALNRAGQRAAALALYQALPAEDIHPFASYRRDAGLAWGHLRAGRPEEALALAVRAREHAGDGGYTRLRAMGLLLEAKILGPEAGAAALARARGIAARLEDEELLTRAARLDAPA